MTLEEGVLTDEKLLCVGLISTFSFGPPPPPPDPLLPLPWQADTGGRSKSLQSDGRDSSLAEHAVEYRIHVFGVVAEVEQALQ